MANVSICSSVKSIDKARFSSFKKLQEINPKNIEKMIIGVNRYVYVLMKSGVIYTNNTCNGSGNVAYTNIKRGDEYLLALVTLSITTESEYEKHCKPYDDREERLEQYYAIRETFDHLTDAGIKLTKTQIRKLDEMWKRCDIKKLPYWAQPGDKRKPKRLPKKVRG